MSKQKVTPSSATRRTVARAVPKTASASGTVKVTKSITATDFYRKLAKTGITYVSK
jgi:hypothetical protein